VYVRPNSGLASATFLLAQWRPEESVQDGSCSTTVFDEALLRQALEYVEAAKADFGEDFSSPYQSFARAQLLLNEIRVNYGLCLLEGLAEEEYTVYCGKVTEVANTLIGFYEQSDNRTAIGPFAALAYGLRGDVEQLYGDFEAAIASYDAALQIEGISPLSQILFTQYKGDGYYLLEQYELAAEQYEAARQLAEDYRSYGYDSFIDWYVFRRDCARNRGQGEGCEA
jgi:tetratricopeptide (TPR) repeat protein